ncbi:hypothetical protein [Bacillus sp. Marseille-Q1617]|nr:hypothetical protein [Bacillus sp. Marseille-Q1617]
MKPDSFSIAIKEIGWSGNRYPLYDEFWLDDASLKKLTRKMKIHMS